MTPLIFGLIFDYHSNKHTTIFKQTSLCLLLFNQVLWNTTGPDPAGQWQWFVSALEDAQRNNQTVWIMGHIYPGITQHFFF
jgi:hypothetical protein